MKPEIKQCFTNMEKGESPRALATLMKFIRRRSIIDDRIVLSKIGASSSETAKEGRIT